MKKTNLFNFSLAILVLCVISFFSCKKLDSFDKDKFSVYEKFFELPQNADPALVRVVKNLKEQESQNPFVEKFVKSEGYPIWKNAKVSISKKFLYKGENEGGDTTITIPIVPEDAKFVKDLLKVKLAQELLFKLFKSDSPQRLYKAIDSFQPGLRLSKEFNVNNDSPLSTRICP